MYVISKISNAQLIKGKKYKLRYTSGTLSGKHKACIEGISSRYDINYFTDESGNPIPRNHRNIQMPDCVQDLETGDFVRCVSRKIKSLDFGKIYEAINVVGDGYSLRSPLRGSRNSERYYYTLFNNHFEKIDVAKKRDLAIVELLDGDTPKELVYDGNPIVTDLEKFSEAIDLIKKSLDYIRKTGVDATLEEVVKHFTDRSNTISYKEVKSMNIKKMLDASNS